MIDFPCQEIYLLNLYEREDKFQKMQERLAFMGINVIPFRVVKHPFYDRMVKHLNRVALRINKGCEFSCTREHYTIIKSAYIRGVESVGIMEDDISFLKDINEWSKCFNNLPIKWDILRINCLRGHNEEYENLNEPWVKITTTVFGTGFYILNRKAMEWIIKLIDDRYQPIDHILIKACNATDINAYIPTMELSLCIETAENWTSDIREEIDEPHLNYLTIQRFKKENYI